MSAITGIFMRNGKDVDPELMKKMNKKLSHRGPDGSDIWCNGPVGLGHQMLWTTQESLHEKLPFEENDLVITADARIDNRDELSKELGLKDEEDVSDSYFILKAYEMWGKDCPDKLLGDFAFAIWDKTQEKLFCARDHMGVKPFYYYLHDDAFFFATEIKALFSNNLVRKKLNEQKIALYLVDIRDKKFTFFDDIFCLEAAHSLTLSSNESKIRIYWELDRDYKIHMDSEEDYIKAFNEIFTEAVSCRLRSAFPIGFELSGGLDSSSIVCMAKKILSNNNNFQLNDLKTYSIFYDGFPEADESYYIEKVIETGGIKPHFVLAGNKGLLDKMDEILWHVEQPFFTPFMSYIWDFYKKMNKDNVRVVLGGYGSDEILGVGNYYLRELIVTFQWNKLMNEIKGIVKLSATTYSILFKKIIFSLIPMFIKNKMRGKNIKGGFIPRAHILNKKLINKLGGYENFKRFHRSYRGDLYGEIKPKEYQHMSINAITHNRYTAITTVSNSAFRIEPRFPFLDKRIIEFCYAIPTEMIIKSGWTKYILRVGMADIIPNEIQYRTTKGATDEVLYKNFLLFEKDFLENIIYSENEVIEDYVDLDFLKKSYDNYDKGIMDLDNLLCLWFSTLLFSFLLEFEKL